MDEVARYNQNRWRLLTEANALFTRPKTNITAKEAQAFLDPGGLFGSFEGKSVLCLAGGGGQQSVAFALLGARVTVVDLSAEQLERDRNVANERSLDIRTSQSDMRDLSDLADESFDVVWQPYSINFVPNASEVFAEASRVLGPGGLYHFMVANPFAFGMTNEDWDGSGYPVRLPYVAGAKASYKDVDFVYDREEFTGEIPPPVEYRHTLSGMVAGLVRAKLEVRGITEESTAHPDPEPGSWEHFKRVLPPWLTIWAVKTGV